MFSKDKNSDTADFHRDTFTSADLDRTIAHFRRTNAAEWNVARVIDEAVMESPRDFGRLPASVQGPHFPTD